MERVGFIFKIKPEFQEEYKIAHKNVWPELIKAIGNAGIRNYSTFFIKDGTIFGYLETDNYEESMEKLKRMEIRNRWEEYMEKYFIKKDESIVGPEIEILEEVSHLD